MTDVRRRSGRRWARLLGATALVGAGLAAPGASAGLPAAFVGLAAASGARATFVVPGQFAVEEIVDGGGPVAQSALDPLGGQSYAALPYPGGTAVAYQGLFAVATGLSSPFAYPFYVSATNPGNPSAELADPSGTEPTNWPPPPGRPGPRAWPGSGPAAATASSPAARPSPPWWPRARRSSPPPRASPKA